MLILAPVVRACLKTRSCDQVQPELDEAHMSRMGHSRRFRDVDCESALPQEPTSSVRPAPSEKCQLRTYRRNQSSVVCERAVGRANIPLGSNGAAPMPLTKQDAHHLRPLALPLILVVASWAASVHAQGAAGAGSNGSEAVPGPVFSGTGPHAAAYGADARFPAGTPAAAREPGHLRGTYSHFDELFPSRSVGRSSAPWPFNRAPEPTLFYNFRSDRLSITDTLTHTP